MNLHLSLEVMKQKMNCDHLHILHMRLLLAVFFSPYSVPFDLCSMKSCLSVHDMKWPRLCFMLD